VRVQNNALIGGTHVRLSGKSSIDVNVRRSSVNYETGAIFLESDLSRVLDRTSTGEAVTFWYAATPLTTVGVDVQRQRDRFDSAPERDSNRVRVSPVIDFQPHALITGRVAFGIHRREFLGRDVPDSKGTFLHVNLQYALLDRTMFSVEIDRDVDYSYRIREQEYLLTGVTASVTQRFVKPWQLRARFGRRHLTYLAAADSDAQPDPEPDAETAFEYGVDVGYRLGATRLGVQMLYRNRLSNTSVLREYQRFRVSTFVAYAFD
jgi:hypothetical protein